MNESLNYFAKVKVRADTNARKSLVRPDTRGPGVFEIHAKYPFENFSVHFSGGPAYIFELFARCPFYTVKGMALLRYRHISLATLYPAQYKTGNRKRA